MDLEAFEEACTKRAIEDRSVLTKVTAPRKEGWTDDLLQQLRQGLHFHPSTYSRDNLKVVLTRFYNLYLKGVVDPKDHPCSVVYDMVALSRAKGPLIWPPTSQDDLGFYPLNKSESTTLSNLELGHLPGTVILNPGWSEDTKRQYANLMAQYTNDGPTSFANHITLILEQINPTQEETDSEASLIRLSSFLALTLLRFSIKNKEQIGKAFLKNEYKRNLTAIALWNPGSPFSPPCTRCLEICEHALKKGLRTTSQMFTILAHEFVNTNSATYPDPSVMGFLSASVLTDTARNGLGLIQMLDHVMTITSFAWHEVMKYSLFNITQAAWVTIDEFFHTQCNRAKVQYSFNWARIIDPEYFRELSPKEHPFLATIFASIIAQVQGPGVWEAEWVKTSGVLFDAKMIGLAIYQKSKPKTA